jgi:4-hydroxy-tetrahydrodipicolinate reductase
MRVIIHGLGRLGGAIAQLAASEGVAVICAVDSREPGARKADFPVFASLGDCDKPADVIIDSSHAEAVPGLVKSAVKLKMPLVICTTGLSESSLQAVTDAAAHIPILLSSNMSLGVNLLSKLVADAAKTLANAGFDIEIIEAHHNQKLDAPSGTALLLANSINASCGGKFKYVFDRSGYLQKRCSDEIGISAIRGGTIVGEHSVIFAGGDEIVEISHRALSRDIFAKGALAAAKFLKGRPAGLYSMNDLISRKD